MFLSFFMISIDSRVHSDAFNPGERIKWFRPHTPEEARWVSCPTCGDSAALSLPHCLTLRRVAHFTIWAPFFTSTVSGYVQRNGGRGVGKERWLAGERAGEERMKGDRAKGQKKEKSMGMLVREVRTKCEYKRWQEAWRYVGIGEQRMGMLPKTTNGGRDIRDKW